MGPSRIRSRLAIAILLTALIPVLSAVLLARSMVQQSSQRFFVPEIRQRLDQSLSLYRELASEIKAGMRYQASAIAEHYPLRQATQKGDRSAIQRHLEQVFEEHPQLVSLTVESDFGELGRVYRGRPVDEQREHRLVVQRPLSSDVPELLLTAVFATERARFDQLESMSEFVNAYSQLEKRRESDERAYVLAFAILLSLTIGAAVFVGNLLSRRVVTRLGALSRATEEVGRGDLTVRVADRGSDEIGNLARAFNRMLEELEDSRARIEYLNRIATWQELARRMAHEIKNPLTPIQLAVQEIHERYEGGDPTYTKLLGTTLEIVETEVGTLRRLVSEFSNFARLPQAKLEVEDLFQVLREQAEQKELVERRQSDADPQVERDSDSSDVHFDIPDGSAYVAMDVQLFRRALDNLVQNATQAATQGDHAASVNVRAERNGAAVSIRVEDNGPGVPEAQKSSIFDPYFTTKPDGTGLGLAIVKKIVVEHGGRIAVGTSPLGGACIQVVLPLTEQQPPGDRA